jgi:hypothetical protein
MNLFRGGSFVFAVIDQWLFISLGNLSLKSTALVNRKWSDHPAYGNLLSTASKKSFRIVSEVRPGHMLGKPNKCSLVGQLAIRATTLHQRESSTARVPRTILQVISGFDFPPRSHGRLFHYVAIDVLYTADN